MQHVSLMYQVLYHEEGSLICKELLKMWIILKNGHWTFTMLWVSSPFYWQRNWGFAKADNTARKRQEHASQPGLTQKPTKHTRRLWGLSASHGGMAWCPHMLWQTCTWPRGQRLDISRPKWEGCLSAAGFPCLAQDQGNDRCHSVYYSPPSFIPGEWHPFLTWLWTSGMHSVGFCATAWPLSKRTSRHQPSTCQKPSRQFLKPTAALSGLENSWVCLQPLASLSEQLSWLPVESGTQHPVHWWGGKLAPSTGLWRHIHRLGDIRHLSHVPWKDVKNHSFPVFLDGLSSSPLWWAGDASLHLSQSRARHDTEWGLEPSTYKRWQGHLMVSCALNKDSVGSWGAWSGVPLAFLVLVLIPVGMWVWTPGLGIPGTFSISRSCWHRAWLRFLPTWSCWQICWNDSEAGSLRRLSEGGAEGDKKPWTQKTFFSPLVASAWLGVSKHLCPWGHWAQ